jgi:methyltransferase
MTVSIVVFFAVFAPMILESARSKRNDRFLRLQGAVEPARDVYPAMQVVYPGCFLGMIAEGWMRGGQYGGWFVAGGMVFTLAKALKYWAVHSLGRRWTFRVLVPPNAPRVVTGPYRWLRHPNYAAVAGEIAGVALMVRAPVSGALSLLVFGALMLARIRIEEEALDAGAR